MSIGGLYIFFFLGEEFLQVAEFVPILNLLIPNRNLHQRIFFRDTYTVIRPRVFPNEMKKETLESLDELLWFS